MFRNAILGILIAASCISMHVMAKRLPTSIEPEHYQLKIITHLIDSSNVTFDGEISLRFAVVEDTKNITLHARDLEVNNSNIQLRDPNDADFHICLDGVDTEPENGFYIISLCHTLVKGQTYELQLTFSGTLTGNFLGYAHEEISWLGLTCFLPNYARLAFPCLDEPNYKATFTIWLGHHNSLTALSNMPLDKQIPLDGSDDYVWSIFEESPPMSTYLVAYSVHSFISKVAKVEGSDVLLRTWCQPDNIEQCEFVTEIGSQIIKYYEDVFAMPFPMKKLDQIAIPNWDLFHVSNWGLVAYEESFLHVDAGASKASKAISFQIIAEEIATQWLGDLVTVRQWNDWWLYQSLSKLVTSWAQISLSYDYYKSDPLSNIDHIFSSTIAQICLETVDGPDVYDETSYKKGTFILEMLEKILGREHFIEALQEFLTTFKFKNAGQDDLWTILSDKVKRLNRQMPQASLKTIVDSWTMQAGYPVVNVKRNYVTGSMEISQIGDDKKCWWIPLTYTTQSVFDFETTWPKAWLECDESGNSIPIKLDNVAQSDEWIIFNIQASGIYRVMYDVTNWKLIGTSLEDERFIDTGYINLLQIVNDVVHFELNGDLGADITLEILENVVKTTDPKASVLALTIFNKILLLLEHYPQEMTQFKAYMRYVIEPVYNKLEGLNDTIDRYQSHEHIDQKYEVAEFACQVELNDCIRTALGLFQQWKQSSNSSNENTIPEIARDIVYRTAIRHGDNDDWKFLSQQYKATNWNIENNRIITSLVCSRNVSELRESLELLIANHRIDVTSLIDCEYGAYLAWDHYVKQSSDVLFYDFNAVLTELSKHVTSVEDRQRLIKFVGDDSTIRIPFELIDSNIRWIESNLANLRTFLQNRLSAINIYI